MISYSSSRARMGFEPSLLNPLFARHRLKKPYLYPQNCPQQILIIPTFSQNHRTNSQFGR